MSFFVDYLNIISEKIKDVDYDALNQAAGIITLVSQSGGKTIIVGNGGSAAIASHVSVDLTKNANIRAVNFNEADLLTCFSNDYGYERWVEKTIEFYADPEDLLVLISSSGTSQNIINGGHKAKEMDLKVITFSGFRPDNPLRQLGDINFWIDSHEYNIVEITHQIWLLALIERIIENTKHAVHDILAIAHDRQDHLQRKGQRA